MKILRSRPLINAKFTIEEIIGDSHDLLYAHLEACKSMGLGWDVYANRKKISLTLRKEFAKIMKTLRENGFHGPEAIGGKIVCQVGVEGRKLPWHVHRKGCKCIRCKRGIFTEEDRNKNILTQEVRL